MKNNTVSIFLFIVFSFLLNTTVYGQKTDSLPEGRTRELKRLIEKSKKNQRQEYRVERETRRNFSLVDYSNISGTKSLSLETGLFVPFYLSKNKFHLDTYGLELSTIGRNNKNAFYLGVRYVDSKKTEKHDLYYLAGGGVRWYLFSIPFFDFRFDTGLLMGLANKTDYRTGKENNYYALSAKAGLQIYLKLHTYFYLFSSGTVMSIYDTKVLDTQVFWSGGVKIML